MSSSDGAVDGTEAITSCNAGGGSKTAWMPPWAAPASMAATEAVRRTSRNIGRPSRSTNRTQGGSLLESSAAACSRVNEERSSTSRPHTLQCETGSWNSEARAQGVRTRSVSRDRFAILHWTTPKAADGSGLTDPEATLVEEMHDAPRPVPGRVDQGQRL